MKIQVLFLKIFLDNNDIHSKAEVGMNRLASDESDHYFPPHTESLVTPEFIEKGYEPDR